MLDYEPFIERDANGIRQAVRELASTQSFDEVFVTIARFAVLAYAPSQHGKHAFLACLAAHDIREQSGDRWIDILTECAIYAAGSRQPWSEPPITDPPVVDPNEDSSLEGLLAAITAQDRLAAERWLAARIDDVDLRADYFAAASDDLSDFGHKLIVANAAWRLASLLGARGRFAVLRVGIWEMCAYHEPAAVAYGAGAGGVATRPDNQGIDQVAARVIDQAIVEEGSVEALHRLFLYDAAVQSGMTDRVAGYLTTELKAAAATSRPAARQLPDPGPPQPYLLARDYAAWLQSYAVAQRLGDRRIIAAAKAGLDEGSSFEEWSFA